VEGEIEGLLVYIKGFDPFVDRKQTGVEDCTHVTRSTDMREVRGKSIAYIDHRRNHI